MVKLLMARRTRSGQGRGENLKLVDEIITNTVVVVDDALTVEGKNVVNDDQCGSDASSKGQRLKWKKRWCLLTLFWFQLLAMRRRLRSLSFINLGKVWLILLIFRKKVCLIEGNCSKMRRLRKNSIF